MARAGVTVHIRHRWWLMPYLRTLFLFCWIFRMTPDQAKLERMIQRGIYAEFE